MKLRIVLYSLLLCLLSPGAFAETLAPGSYIIPMDTDYQDDGMLKAYGLVYQLLLADVPVRWCIQPGKAYGGTDFTASATDVETSAVVSSHDYRGGPFAISSTDAAAALPVITAWQTNHVTAVHEATTSFDCEVSRLLVNAPTIAMVADGNQKVAREYMEAAGIPDSIGDLDWPDSSPDMLDITELAGPTDTNHADGELFGPDGKPVYCQLMSMHWGVNDAQNNPEVVAEVRQFLNYPTHFFAECQAVNAYENHPNGRFLTPNGFEIENKPDEVDFHNADQPFAQLDGEFETVGGSEPSYSLPQGDQYKAQDITMVTEQGTPVGVRDIWMTGFLDGVCPPHLESCGAANFGKISYLGGHEYDTKLPISDNPKTQGTRLFLNSLFEAPCATANGAPDVALTKTGPAATEVDMVTWSIEYINQGVSIANDVVVRDTLPAGATFVSATQGGQLVGNEVVWNVGSVAESEFGEVSVTVQLAAEGSYDNTASVDYRAGVNVRTADSNTVTTVYCVAETDAELCTAAVAQCGTLMVSDRCGTARMVDCETGVCDGNAICDATNQCACDAGWTGNGLTCTNIDECSTGAAMCDPNATCTDLPGSFDCTCNAGFFGNGLFCTDTDECANNPGCDANATCNNIQGGFECVCDAGYAGDGFSCMDVDECATNVCDPVATCTNSVGSFTCACPAGYVGDGFTCVDIDECANATAGCDPLATCTNSMGGFACDCPGGYAGDGFTCSDVDECAAGTDNCMDPAVCTNNDGGFECECPPGYNEIGAACLDADECLDGTHDCVSPMVCSNTAGSFECGCGPGFEADGAGCADIDECARDLDDCPDAATCTNAMGTFSCACPDGNPPTEGMCPDGAIDECALELDDCDPNAACTDTVDGFDCTCGAGYEGDGTECSRTAACEFIVCDEDDEVCLDGDCVAACSEDGDCPSGDECRAGACQPIDCDEQDCGAVGECPDEPCATNEVCVDGQCMLASTACESTLDCAEGEVCEGGLCTADGDATLSAGSEGGCCATTSSNDVDAALPLVALLLLGLRRRR